MFSFLGVLCGFARDYDAKNSKDTLVSDFTLRLSFEPHDVVRGDRTVEALQCQLAHGFDFEQLFDGAQ